MFKMRTKNLTLFSKIERSFSNGRDENLSKTGLWHRWPLENLSLVDVDHENISLVNIIGRSLYSSTTRKPQSWGFYWSTSTRLRFSNGGHLRSTLTTDFFMVDVRLSFSSRPFKLLWETFKKKMQKPKGTKALEQVLISATLRTKLSEFGFSSHWNGRKKSLIEGLSKKATCLRGLEAAQPNRRN